jgi:hypothetical protein
MMSYRYYCSQFTAQYKQQQFFFLTFTAMCLVLILLFLPNNKTSVPIQELHYQVLNNGVKIEVDMMHCFLFSCLHCYFLEKETNSFADYQERNLTVKNIQPSSEQSLWNKLSHLYPLLDGMGLSDQYKLLINIDVHKKHILKSVPVLALDNRHFANSSIARDTSEFVWPSVS